MSIKSYIKDDSLPTTPAQHILQATLREAVVSSPSAQCCQTVRQPEQAPGSHCRLLS